MTKLSVNINKIATLRNSRGGNYPNVCDFAINIQNFGALNLFCQDLKRVNYSFIWIFYRFLS